MMRCPCSRCSGLDSGLSAVDRFPFGEPIDGALAMWMFWTAWQIVPPRWRPDFTFRVNLSIAKVKRARVRASRHAPNHSPRTSRGR